MSVTHTFTYSWRGGSEIPLSEQVSITGDAEVNLDIVVNNTVVNQLVPFVLDRSKVQGIFIDPDSNVTVKTNSSGSPTDTLTLLASDPVAWTINDGLAKCPFTADVTALYVSNSSGKQSNTLLRVVYNL